MKKLKRICLYFLSAVILSTNIVYAEPIVKDQEFFDAVKEYIMQNYALEVSEEQLYDAAIKGMFDALDPYSYYMTSEEYTSFMEEAQGEFAGIGAVIGKKENEFYLVSINQDTPASKAGLKPMDVITSVNGTVVDTSKDTQFLVKQIRGKEGTSVKLTIKRGNENLTFNIVREKIKINPVEYKVLEKGLGYIRITEFNKKTYENMTTAIQELEKQNIKKVILDLRGNPGGSLEQAQKVSNYFVPKGKLLEVRYKTGEPDKFYSSGDIKFEKLVVLIDSETASAAEILAGAIQDTKSGTLIGTTTYGKGVVQDLYTLRNGEAIKLTVAKYILPSGRNIDLKGINPDKKVEYIIPKNNSNDDNQLDEAIKIIKQR